MGVHVTTYRLYLDQSVDDAARQWVRPWTSSSTATQRFDLEGARVVPQILMSAGFDRVSFRTAIGKDSTIRAELRPEGRAGYEIRLHQDGTDRLLAGGEINRATSIACPFPTGTGVLEFIGRGQLTWSDLRVQRNLEIAPELWGLGIVAVLAWVRTRRHRTFLLKAAPSAPLARGASAWLAILTVLGSTASGLLIVEAGLRAVGTKLSGGISSARHDLGERTDDPRWQQSTRYGQRLAANFDAVNQWRYGDIIRMGFLPPAVADGRVHRYGFHTDAEGFRNRTTRDRIDVAALGDSFTDALTMPMESGWAMQLEGLIDRPVQNYGTAGFGPQQELLVLKDYALHHQPRVVVLAFFGNDLRDAEVFELTGRTDVAIGHPALGWPIKDVVSRADTWFLVSALRAAAIATVSEWRAGSDASTAGRASPPPGGPAAFDGGMFSVPVNGRVLRWAFMPPYLKLLNFSEHDLEARRGWTLTGQAIGEMQRVSRAAGAELVVMFLPFKSQVYLPLLLRTFSRAELAADLQMALHGPPEQPDVDAMSRNRLALNALMRRFCETTHIPFVDTTGALQARVDAGDNVYFPDDSHLNEAGEAIVAAELARFLRDRRLLSPADMH